MPIIFEKFGDVIARYPEAANAGRQLAEADLAAGRLRFIQCWPIHCYSFADWHPHYVKLLHERLGVEAWSHVPNPFPEPDAGRVFEAEHYAIMAAGIEARFGVGILEQLVSEAKQAHAAESRN
jgi:hypothetical protein